MAEDLIKKADGTNYGTTMAGNFIHDIIDEDIKNQKYHREIRTRFPPEPNGYLHIGHCKSICLNAGTALKYGGTFNLRYDDTNPITEDEEFVGNIEKDVQWLGFQWDNLLFASDYFDKMYECAEKLIRDGNAYISAETADEIKATRGTLTQPGTNSPYRDRPWEESLQIFHDMRDGKYADGEVCLRAKIDMASPNINMRDPVIYRVLHASHHNTGDKWCVYPMYDYAHPIEDAIEGITHSICTLEFEDHRPLYNWVLEKLEWPEPPQQIEFAKLGLTNTIMSKRNIKRLVNEGIIESWDDPRLCTIAGMRRRGYTPEALRAFCESVGVAKAENKVDYDQLEFFVREDLKDKVENRMVVLNPLKVVIDNYPEGKSEMCTLENAADPAKGTREVSFSRELWIEREDFMEVPAKKYFRMFPGNEVRLKGAYFVTCTDVVKDAEGNVTEIHCTYDPDTKSGTPGADSRKVKGTIHWVDAATCVDIPVRNYPYLALPDPEKPNYFNFDPNSRQDKAAKAEPSLKDAKAGDRFQFFRNGYYITDTVLSKEGEPVFNQTVGLKSSYKK